jgi:hypothetical protein
MMPAQRNRRVWRSSQRGQSLAEAAVLFPLILLVALGGISIDSYIQAQAQANQAVSRAALVAARNTFDPCMPGDEPGAMFPATPLPNASGGQPHGFQDVVDAFNSALTSPLLKTNPTSTLTITCTSAAGVNPQASVTTTIIGGGPPSTTMTQPVNAWGGWSSLQPGAWPGNCTTAPPPLYDNGCFAVWRGGTVTVKYSSTLTVSFTPFWRSVTISASAGGQIEPFRNHTCPNLPANGTPAC